MLKIKQDRGIGLPGGHIIPFTATAGFYEDRTFPLAREAKVPPAQRMPNTAKAILKLVMKRAGSV